MSKTETPSTPGPASDGPIPATRAELIAIAESDYAPGLVGIRRDRISDIFWPLGEVEPRVIQVGGRAASNAAGSLAFLLIVTAINYQLWQRKAGAIVRYHHAAETGAPALWGACSSAWGLEDPTPDQFRAALAEGGIVGVFGDIPVPAGRKKILDEILSERAVDTFCATVIRQGLLLQRVTVADARAIAQRFPIAFADPYLVKAQLALAMFSACARGAGISHDAANLTAFADYRIPWVLRALGILRYSKDVADAVDSWHLLPTRSAAERAVRAATILACEEIAAHTGRTAVDVDLLLWASQEVSSTAPFHLTETTSY
jgi:hypothetical protein